MSLSKGLVGHWRLDQESFNPDTKRFTDLTPYENHGTGNGTQLGSADPGFQADRMGQLERAAPFNGSNDYINCGNDARLNISDSITIAAWVYPTSTSSIAIYGKKYSADRGQYWLSLNLPSSNKIRFSILKADGVSIQNIDTDIAVFDVNKWNHIIATYDSSYAIIYVNRTIAKSLYVGNLNVPDAVLDSTIGTLWYSGYVDYFDGIIADVRIYNRTLSQQEITLLYESYRV